MKPSFFFLTTVACLLLILSPSSAPGRSSVLDAASREGELKTGEFQDDIADWDARDVRVYWKRHWYTPVRCAARDGATLYHLWVDAGGNPVTDKKLVEELFTALLFLRDPTPEALAREAQRAETRAAVCKQEEADYAEIAGEATAVQIAAEAFSIYMSLASADPSSYWDTLSGSISVYNSIDLFSNLMRLYGNADDLSEAAIRRMLNEQRTNLMQDILGKHYSRASLGKSVAEAAMLIKRRHDLTKALAAESNLLRRFRIKGSLATTHLDLKKAVTSLGWSVFTYVEDTGAVAQGAAEFSLMNRTLYMCHLKIADIYRRAARGELANADELELLALWVPMTTELRGALLERYLKAYQARRKTFSGKLWGMYETVRGPSVEEEAQAAIATNRDLLAMEQEHFRRALVSLEVELGATLAALARAEAEPGGSENVPSGVLARDLGNVLYSDAPKTWTIDVPANFVKVEAAIYSAGKDEQNMFGGWQGSLKVNGNYAWKFLRHNPELGGMFRDYATGEDVREVTCRNAYYDITSMVHAGRNTITYYHYTAGPGLGVKIRIHTR